MLDELVLVFDRFLSFLEDGREWLAGLQPDQVLRVFWALIFLEIPRYLVTNLYVIYLYLTGDGEVARPSRLLSEQPLVSIIVPAYNEQSTIAHTVNSLLEQDYSNHEIVIVDDGSNDRTREICDFLGTRGHTRCYHFEERQGKSAALNFGLSVSHGEFIVFMDADTTLDRDAVSNLVKYFDDENVGVVSGNLGVRNRKINLLTRLQAVEYLITITVGRRFKAAVRILSIAPGAIGAFRRSLLERVGLLEPGPGNDSDVTIRNRKVGKDVAFAHDATGLTNVPEVGRTWLRQRMRWDRNIVRNRIRKHKDIFNVMAANFRFSNFFSFVDNLFYGVLLPVLWFFYLIDTAINYPRDYGYILFTVVAVQLGLHSIRVTLASSVSGARIDWSDLLLTFPFYSFYRIAIKLVRIVSVFQELLFRSSYQDPFVPKKVREQMEIY